MALSKYFARVCYNTNDWTHPSGDAPRTEATGTYASRMGFGHEEWLFNFNWMWNEWKYAFLEPVRRTAKCHDGDVISVLLFTVGDNGQWFKIGEIHECELITLEQADMARREFQRRGWLRRMDEHVQAVQGRIRGLHAADPRTLFNVRFKLSDVTVFDPYRIVSESDGIRRIKRYMLVDATNVPTAVRDWPKRRAASARKLTGTIFRSAIRAGRVSLIHNELQEELVDWLRKKYGRESVVVEENFVDVKLRRDGKLSLLEIKSDPRPGQVLRNAIGQLLDYEFRTQGSGEVVSELIAAGPAVASTLDDEYLAYLRARFSIPIRYVCLRPENGDLLL